MKIRLELLQLTALLLALVSIFHTLDTVIKKKFVKFNIPS